MVRMWGSDIVGGKGVILRGVIVCIFSVVRCFSRILRGRMAARFFVGSSFCANGESGTGRLTLGIVVLLMPQS